MKIKPDHYALLEFSLNKFMGEHPYIVEQYETGDFIRSDRVNDLQMRFCFDMLWLCNLTWLRPELSTYLEDSHVYTALKRILPKVERRY